jgi:type I restriction enzyme M protein
MARILDPQPGQTVYGPCGGSSGVLIKCHMRLLETHGEKSNGRLKLPAHVAPIRPYGQEINPSTFAMSRMNAFIHDMGAKSPLGDAEAPAGAMRVRTRVGERASWFGILEVIPKSNLCSG